MFLQKNWILFFANFHVFQIDLEALSTSVSLSVKCHGSFNFICFVLFCFLFVSGFVIYLCRYPKKYFIFVICCLILTWLTITDNFGYLTIPSFIRCLSVHPLTFPFSAFLAFFIPYFALALELNSHCSTWFWSTIFSTYWPIMLINMFY